MSSLASPRPDATPTAAAQRLSEALDAAHAALLDYRADPAALDRVGATLLAAARELGEFPHRAQQPALCERALTLAREVRKADVFRELGARRADDLFSTVNACGWPALVARMLLSPAWECECAPLLGEVPQSLWGAYAEWLFTPPARSLTATEAERLASHLTRHADELARWCERNLGSASVRAAMESYLKNASLLPFARTAVDLRPLARARAKIITRSSERTAPAKTHAVPRVGRALRVGVVCRDLEASVENFFWLARIEHLDGAGFERIVFSGKESNTPLAKHCRATGTSLEVLPADPKQARRTLATAGLDVLVFANSLVGEADDYCRLATYRYAPLQVALASMSLTTGFKEVDLVIAGATTPAGDHNERLALIGGPAPVFSFSAPPAESEPVFERAALDLPEDALVFGAVIDATNLSTAPFAAWAGILAGAPGARLIAYVISPSGESGEAGHRFCAQLHAALGEHGVAAERVAVFVPEAPAIAEARALLRLAQVVLMPRVCDQPFWTAEALMLGLPVVTGAAGEAAQLLGNAGIAELAAADDAAYVMTARALADSSTREKAQARIAVAHETGFAFADTLAASDAFAHVLEAAFDELSSLGRDDFRHQVEPVRCFAVDDIVPTVEAGLAAHAAGDYDTAAMEANLALRSAPADARARQLYGMVLHAQGNAARAIEYLLAAVQAPDAPASAWHALALALRDNRQMSEAIKALEACLRLDPQNVAALFVLLELAEGAGATELARDVLRCLQEVAPDDPRVMALS